MTILSGRRPAVAAAGMVALFSVLYGTGQFHRVAQGVMAPELERDLQLGADALGAISAVLFLASGAAQVPIGVLLDRFGPRRTVPALLSFGVAGSLLFAAASSAGELMLARILIGLGYASVMMGAFVAFARWFPPDRFARISSLMIAAGNLGGLLATAPLALLVAALGWRPVFVGAALLTAALGLVMSFTVRDAPPGYRAVHGGPATLMESITGLREVLREPRLRYILAVGLVGYGPSMTILGLWGGPYLGDVFGLDAAERGYVLFAMALASPVGLLAVGSLDRRFNTRKGVVLALAGASAGTLAMLALAAEAAVWLSAAAFVAISFLQTFYVVTAAHCRAIFPDHLVGRANTMLNLAAIAGVAIMQGVTGLIVDAFPAEHGIADPIGYRLVFGALAVMVALGTLVYARVEDAPPQPRTVPS